ncbi:MAG: leucyl aminopeptidase family protein [Azospirillaceae bacterium]|nr:leucyl aminopeptidase family protein [Azospirillaceae bacterium]
MLDHLSDTRNPDAVVITPIAQSGLASALSAQPAALRAWLAGIGFTAEPGTTALLPGDGGVGAVWLGVAEEPDLWSYAGLPAALPVGSYRLDPAVTGAAATRAVLGWALGSYRFTRYCKPTKDLPVLQWPETVDRPAVERTIAATQRVRDLVNTPAADLGPAELADAALALAQPFKAKVKLIVGDELLEAGYPAIHAVGRASDRKPRLIDLTWGRKSRPLVTLVGKGVCFDSGGLDIKPSSSMLLMKKDMGGAAHALAIAGMIMAAGLPVRLRVLIPAVENVIAGNAFKPMDVLSTRQGLTVEVGNTDAEGRLILADALAEACRAQPELLIDFATLTGAARVALGPEITPFYSNDDALAAELAAQGDRHEDPLWRMPLWQPYQKFLESKVADLSSTGTTPFAGSITAALFLQRFVAPTVPWIHLDLFAWNPTARPGRPEGGEALGLRAVYALIESRFAPRGE